LKARYTSNDSLGNSKLYDAIDGELSITKEKDEILYGNFSFTFVNTRDRADTIRMSDGYYEVTMEKYLIIRDYEFHSPCFFRCATHGNQEINRITSKNLWIFNFSRSNCRHHAYGIYATFDWFEGWGGRGM